MSKVLVSFRIEQERLDELSELASVYTNGNRTELIERLVRQMYFLEPLAKYGMYRSIGGVDRETHIRFKKAWNVWMQNISPGGMV